MDLEAQLGLWTWVGSVKRRGNDVQGALAAFKSVSGSVPFYLPNPLPASIAVLPDHWVFMMFVFRRLMRQ